MEKKKTPIIQQQYMNTISIMLVGFGFFPEKCQLYTPRQCPCWWFQFTNGGCGFGCKIETSDIRRPVSIVDEVVGVQTLVVGNLVVGTGDYMDEIEHLDECLHHPGSVLQSAGAPVCVEKVKMLFVFSQDKQYWTEDWVKCCLQTDRFSSLNTVETERVTNHLLYWRSPHTDKLTRSSSYDHHIKYIGLGINYSPLHWKCENFGIRVV